MKVADFLSARAAWVAAASVVLFALGTVVVYRDYPLSMDEYAAVFQSKIFAAGQLSAQLPPSYVDWLVVRGFNGEFLIASRETGRAIEVYWPGFALLLAPFELLQVQWLCNACLAALALLLIHSITTQITQDKRAAGWALLFALGSGAFVANAISFYSLQAHLTANLLFVALLLRPSRTRALCAGLVGSVALILHNPVPACAVCSPVDHRHVRGSQSTAFLPAIDTGIFAGTLHWVGVAVAQVGHRVFGPNVAERERIGPRCFYLAKRKRAQHARSLVCKVVGVGRALPIRVRSCGCLRSPRKPKSAPAGRIGSAHIRRIFIRHV